MAPRRGAFFPAAPPRPPLPRWPYGSARGAEPYGDGSGPAGGAVRGAGPDRRAEPYGTGQISGRSWRVSVRPGPTPMAEIGAPLISSRALT
ncbi:hypothetical protein Ppa06_56310 [Planomonospora parontospora subsp. parontospora]|uniref:Uncharacterized protein n=2 Tax=Planomonospora parontospora TaxID=58119 RepID=A0AA37F642_9ACTN|nr:hypothetical protein GCM10010126_45220 [Planomonospora parontospora]GII11833.1 hypothetical protein Ppa06_56310 [Planomonospora parontospora subsp. parontospora]